MRPSELVRSAVGGLWRQKARTALTLTGVAVGACALAFSLSLGIGLRAMIDHEFKSRAEFWVVRVSANYAGPPVPEDQIPPEKIAVEGEMSEDRRARLRASLVQKYRQEHPSLPPVELTAEKIADLAALPDVEAVDVWHYQSGTVRVGGGKALAANVSGGSPLDRPTLRERLVLGRVPDPAADECLVSEFALYRLGVRSDAEMAAAVGRPLTVTLGGGGSPPASVAQVLGVKPADLTATQEAALGQVAARLPAAVDKLDLSPAERAVIKGLLAGAAKKPAGGADDADGPREPVVATFRVAGVVRALTPAELQDLTRPDGWEERFADVLLPPAANPVFEATYHPRQRRHRSAEVRVRPGGDLRAVVAGVERTGLSQFSLLEWHDRARREVTLIAAGLNAFAMAALLVAALGITNTFVTSVVERTREIGILRAVGATTRQVTILFLMEGAVVGLAGGLLGLALAWGLSVPGDAIARDAVEQVSQQQLKTETVFVFPGWLLAGTVVFAVAVTTLAALYPARRAARVQPIEALRHA